MLLTKLDMEHLLEMVLTENRLLWSIKDGKHWISNGHIALIFDQNELEDDEEGWILADFLERTFESKKPTEGNTVMVNYGAVTTREMSIADTIQKSYLPPQTASQGIVTPLIWAKGGFRYRWIKFQGFDVFLNDLYASVLFDGAESMAFSEGPEKPVSFYDGRLIILPVKNVGSKEVIEQLEAFGEMMESLDSVVEE